MMLSNLEKRTKLNPALAEYSGRPRPQSGASAPRAQKSAHQCHYQGLLYENRFLLIVFALARLSDWKPHQKLLTAKLELPTFQGEEFSCT
eukprot:1435245-Amphidinium_carterae.1